MDVKNSFSVKKLISTSKRHAEHLFAGRNTQQLISSDLLSNVATIHITKLVSNLQVRIAIEPIMDVSVGHLPVSIPTIVQKILADQGSLALDANVSSTTTKHTQL